METRSLHKPDRLTPESGMTLVETLIALAILLIVASGIMGIAVIATTTTENQGHLAARAAEYAQDKMEQLISLNYGDAQTDTTSFPAGATGGTGLTVGGSTSTSAPVVCYVDFLDVTGAPLTLKGAPPACANTLPAANYPDNWYYKRVWQISAGATPQTKQITITTIVNFNVGGSRTGALAQATVTGLKTYPY